jgi:molybdopterin synthase sulfur carrier subunit
MNTAARTSSPGETDVIHVHYWASARAAAGVDGEAVAVDGAISLADLVRMLVERHPGGNLGAVLHVCSVLRGDEPVRSRDPETVSLLPGQSVEFLPPFAGG